MRKATIGNSSEAHNVLSLGCWAFGGSGWNGQEDADSLSAMEKAFEKGLTHFDTAMAYGGGRSEKLVGEFIKGKREQLYIATKGNTSEGKAEPIINSLDKSLGNLGVDCIDLYYIHWPNKDFDMRPVVEGLEKERAKGKFKQLGVSNFSVEQMKQAMEVGTIDAHQLCYSLVWRFDEGDIIPFCIENNIDLVTYSSLGQGILTGKFPKDPKFEGDDVRQGTTLFKEDVWPHIYEGVEEMKVVAEEAGRPLADLAIQWVAKQAGVASVLVGARNADQVERNAVAMDGEIAAEYLDKLTDISNRTIEKIPDSGNIFQYYP